MYDEQAVLDLFFLLPIILGPLAIWGSLYLARRFTQERLNAAFLAAILSGVSLLIIAFLCTVVFPCFFSSDVGACVMNQYKIQEGIVLAVYLYLGTPAVAVLGFFAYLLKFRGAPSAK